MKVASRATLGALGFRIPALFFKRIEVPFLWENCESSVEKCIDVVIIKLESSESGKIPVIFLLFLNLKNIIQRYILFRTIFVCLFCELDPCPRKFLVAHLVAMQIWLVG